jgi:sugar/nucleoside kinase (ribokinase family)
LIETLTANGIATEGVLTTRESNISLAAVTVSPDGEREFLIYRNGSADSIDAPREVATDVIRATRILHVGSLWLGEPICGAAQRHAVQIAPEAAILVSLTSIYGPRFGGTPRRCARWRSKRRRRPIF